MARPKLTLFVDVNFPVFRQCDVKYIPIFLGGVMKACGNTPPLNIKNKGAWIAVERLRWAREFNIPMSETMPSNFPPLTLGVMRAMCTLTMLCPDQMPATFDALFKSLFVEENPRMNEPEGWEPIMEQVLGTERASEVVKMSTTAEVKALLMKNSDEAFAEGAFGLPWWVATNREGKKQCFWGFDHTKQVIRHLGLDETTESKTGDEYTWRASTVHTIRTYVQSSKRDE